MAGRVPLNLLRNQYSFHPPPFARTHRRPQTTCDDGRASDEQVLVETRLSLPLRFRPDSQSFLIHEANNMRGKGRRDPSIDDVCEMLNPLPLVCIWD